MLSSGTDKKPGIPHDTRHDGLVPVDHGHMAVGVVGTRATMTTQHGALPEDHSPVARAIGRRLMSLRKTTLDPDTNRPYSLEAAAEAIGVSHGAIGSWEKGKTSPKLTDAVALADLYGCCVQFLVTDDDSPSYFFEPELYEEQLDSSDTMDPCWAAGKPIRKLGRRTAVISEQERDDLLRRLNEHIRDIEDG